MSNDDKKQAFAIGIVILLVIFGIYLVLMYFVAMDNSFALNRRCVDNKGYWQANPVTLGATGVCKYAR